jgi:hypothetical protein
MRSMKAASSHDDSAPGGGGSAWLSISSHAQAAADVRYERREKRTMDAYDGTALPFGTTSGRRRQRPAAGEGGNN